MKTRITLFAIAALTMIAISSCKKEKQLTSTPADRGEVVIKQYCSTTQFPTTAENFRASASGTSQNQENARKMARSNASGQMAQNIKQTMQIVGDNFTKAQFVNNKEDANATFQELIRTTVDLELKGCVVVCEELVQTANGDYTCYMALELKGGNILDAYNNSLSNNEKLKADYDYEKFKETFDKEMEKRAQGK